MPTPADSTWADFSKGLLWTSLGAFVFAVLCLPATVLLWPAAAALAAAGLLLRIVGVQQISLAGWLGLVLMLSIAALTGLSALNSEDRLWKSIALPALLPALVVWVLGTFTTWLFVVDSFKTRDTGERIFYFLRCMLAAPAMIGVGVTFAGVVIGLIGCLADPMSPSAGAFLLIALVSAGLGAAVCWPISSSFCNLIRSARKARRACTQPQ